MSRWLYPVALAATLAVVPRAAEAACTVSSSGVAFGTYDVFATAPTDSTGTVTFRCTQRDKDIRISISQGSSPTFLPRQLTRPGSLLFYNLFLDAARTVVWGDGSGGTDAYYNHNPQGNNADIELTVFGRLPPGQDASVGTYTDTVIVTIDF
jgi:spore coat protein U domain-containing protein, fimbrial subunit CupE1/2/3/6